jgi:uncharacterized membrane protein YdbT with pleckstrin-like domain
MDPLKEFKPKFILKYQLILTLFGIIPYIFLLRETIKDYGDLSRSAMAHKYISGLLLPYLVVTIFLLIKFFIYQSTTFYITDLFVQYKRDFITLSQKILRYRDVKEITLHRNVLQKLFGLGTIKVVTHATVEHAGIKFYDIKNYQEVYDILIEKAIIKSIAKP